MKKILLITLIAISINSEAQFHEFTGGFGSAFYFGDLNVRNTENGYPFAALTDNFDFKSTHASYSIGYRMNFRNKFSLGFSYYHMNLSGDDKDNTGGPGSNSYGRKLRELSFHTAVDQGVVDVRFEPFRTPEKMLPTKKWFVSPFLGVGVGLFKFNPKDYYQGKEIELQPLGTEGQGLIPGTEKYRLTEYCIPLSLGVKLFSPSRMFSIGLNAQYSYTFTDYIDDVSTSYADHSLFANNYDAATAAAAMAMSNRNPNLFFGPGHQRGDKEDNDHFITTQLQLSYYFRVKPGCCTVSY